MKALVLERYSEFSYGDVPVPELAPDAVLIDVGAWRHLRERRARYGRQHRPPPAADHHGPRGGR